MGRKAKIKRSEEHAEKMARKQASREAVSRGIKACRDQARAAGRPLGTNVVFRPAQEQAPQKRQEGKTLTLTSPEDVARVEEARKLLAESLLQDRGLGSTMNGQEGQGDPA